MIGPHSHAGAPRVRVVRDTQAANHNCAQPICECGCSASPWPEPRREVHSTGNTASCVAPSHRLRPTHTDYRCSPCGTPHEAKAHAKPIPIHDQRPRCSDEKETTVTELTKARISLIASYAFYAMVFGTEWFALVKMQNHPGDSASLSLHALSLQALWLAGICSSLVCGYTGHAAARRPYQQANTHEQLRRKLRW
jgi:hypothetical protein